jgi:hypothetical protein
VTFDLLALLLLCAPLIVLGILLLWWSGREKRSKHRR